MFLRHPGPHLKEILLDIVAFSLYTPCAIASTYMLMMMCEQLVKSQVVKSGTFSSHIIAFTAVFGKLNKGIIMVIQEWQKYLWDTVLFNFNF